jgi:hypothetical protein
MEVRIMKKSLRSLFAALIKSGGILLAVLSGGAVITTLSTCSPLSNSLSSGSSSVSSYNLVGIWYLNINEGNNTNNDQMFFYSDGVFSDLTGSGTWTMAGNIFIATYNPTNSFVAGITCVIYGSVNGTNASGTEILSVSNSITNIVGTNTWTGIQTSSESYLHGDIQIVNNSTNAIQDLCTGPYGYTNYIENTVTNYNGVLYGVLAGGTSATRVVTTGIYNFNYCGLGSIIVYSNLLQVNNGQTATFTIPAD